MRKVIPVGKKILLKQQEIQETYSNTGIFIPESHQEKECKGKVIAVGKDVEEIKDGDFVQYSEHSVPTTMEHNGEEHLLVQAGDVFAIIRDE